MFSRAHIFALLCLFLSPIFLSPLANAQESAKSFDDYVDRGGFKAFEFGDLDDTYEDIIKAIYRDKGNYFKSNITIYTESHAFTGSVIQVTDRIVVMLDQTRTGPRDTDVKALHVISLNDVTGVTAYRLN
jgi:hypothetical protein